MSQRQDEDPLREKIEEIRGRLLQDDITKEELEMMHLQLDALAKWDRLAAAELAGHDHDHMDDHDHTAMA